MKILFLLFTAIFIVNVAFSQIKLSGEIRPRAEYNHGYKSLAGDNQNASLFTSQRTRLNPDYALEN